MEEIWLSGELPGMSAYLMPAAHALKQAALDVSEATGDLTFEDIWMQPHGVTAAGFQLNHIAGSIDRLLTYCRNERLSEKQFEFLAAENTIDRAITARDQIARAVGGIQKAIDTIYITDENSLFQKREVGRKKLPTNVFGLLFHIAEHTQRHAGQLVTTVKIVKSFGQK